MRHVKTHAGNSKQKGGFRPSPNSEVPAGRVGPVAHRAAPGGRI